MTVIHVIYVFILFQILFSFRDTHLKINKNKNYSRDFSSETTEKQQKKGMWVETFRKKKQLEIYIQSISSEIILQK